MAKRGSPALYELIRARGHEPTTPPTPAGHVYHAAEPPLEETPLPGGWLRPGRLLRVPLGYVFVALAAAILVASLTYMLGYSRGKHESRIMLEEDSTRLGGAGANVPRDPLENHQKAAGPSVTGPLATHSAGPSPRHTAEWDPIESDPRQSGLHYLILMTTDRSGAERFVNFARERGLETYMISSDNRRFRVFAMPGFADPNSVEAAAFRESVLRHGRTWMEQERTRVNPVGTSMWSLYGPRN